MELRQAPAKTMKSCEVCHADQATRLITISDQGKDVEDILICGKDHCYESLMVKLSGVQKKEMAWGRTWALIIGLGLVFLVIGYVVMLMAGI